MSERSPFRGPFNKQHGKRAKAMLKSASQHFYHLLIPAKSIELDKVSLSDMPIVGIAC